MSDACDFYAAIREAPADDALSLVFADWLDEHPSPWNTCTAEFLRLSCRGGRALPVAAGKWLDNLFASEDRRPNWQRLIPALAEVIRAAPRSFFWYGRHGRWVALNRSRLVPDIEAPFGERRVNNRVDLEFHRGFVKRVVCRSWQFWDVVGPLLVCDQPLLEPELTGAWVHVVGTEFHASVDRVGPALRLIDKDDLFGIGGAPTYHSGFRGDGAQERARLALAKALVLRAEAVRAGTARAGVDVVANAEAAEHELGVSEGG